MALPVHELRPVGEKRLSEKVSLLDDLIVAGHVASQLPVEHWHDAGGDPTFFGAPVLDRPLNNSTK